MTPSMKRSPNPKLSETDNARNAVNEGLRLEKLERIGEAIQKYDGVITKYNKRTEPALIRAVAFCYIFKADSIRGLKRKEEAIKIYLEFIEKYQNSKDEEILKLLNCARKQISDLPSNN